MRRPSVVRGTAVIVAVAMFGVLLPTSFGTAPASAQTTGTTPPPPPPPTAAQEALRTDYQGFLTGLEGAVNAAKGNPLIARNLSFGTADPAASIATARSLVAQLNSTQLDELRAGLSAAPTWQQMTSKLSTSVAAFQAAPSSKAGGTFTDDCASAGNAADGFEAAFIANEVQSALQAVMIAAPGVIALFFFDIPDPVKIVLAIAWGIANAIYLALAQVSAVSLDCAATAVSDTQTLTFPVDPANPGVIVAGSTEISIQNLIEAAGDTQTEITNVQNTIIAIGLKTDQALAAAAQLNVTLGGPTAPPGQDINARSTETQDDLKLLQANVKVLINTEGIVLGKADNEILKLSDFQTLQLRMDIEENLTRNGSGTGPVALFQLPATPGGGGGYLEIAKAIVIETIAKETAVGHGNSKANVDLATANQAYANRQWKTAYNYYSKAYQDVR
jgi:hypothetical protein